MAIDISQLIASAKSKVGKVAQKFDRDQSMPGFQLAQGGLRNNISNFLNKPVQVQAKPYNAYFNALETARKIPTVNYALGRGQESASRIISGAEMMKRPGIGNKALGGLSMLSGGLSLTPAGQAREAIVGVPLAGIRTGSQLLSGQQITPGQNLTRGVTGFESIGSAVNPLTRKVFGEQGGDIASQALDIGNMALGMYKGGKYDPETKFLQSVQNLPEKFNPKTSILKKLDFTKPEMKENLKFADKKGGVFDLKKELGGQDKKIIAKIFTTASQNRKASPEDIDDIRALGKKYLEGVNVNRLRPEAIITDLYKHAYAPKMDRFLSDVKTPKLSVEPTKSNPIQDLAIRKNSPQELAYDLARKLNNFDMGDIKLSKDQKIELQQWDNKNGNIITSRGITAVKDTPKWVEDAWKASQQPSKPLSVEPTGGKDLLSEARKYKSVDEFISAQGRDTLSDIAKARKGFQVEIDRAKQGIGEMGAKIPQSRIKERVKTLENQLKIYDRYEAEAKRLAEIYNQAKPLSVEPVGGKPIKVYRGEGSGVKRQSLLGDGTYVTEDPNIAKSFGPNVKEYEIVGNPKLLEADSPEFRKIKNSAPVVENERGVVTDGKYIADRVVALGYDGVKGSGYDGISIYNKKFLKESSPSPLGGKVGGEVTPSLKQESPVSIKPQEATIPEVKPPVSQSLEQTPKTSQVETKPVVESKPLDNIISNESKQRGFLETVQESPKTRKGTKVKIKALPQEYDVVGNKGEVKKADKLISMDVDEAKRSLLAGEVTGVNETVLGIRLAKHYEKTKQLDSAVDVIEHLDRQLRESGRAIQAASLWNKMSPEAILRSANRVAEKLGKQLDDVTKQTIVKRMGEVSKMPEGEAKQKATVEVLNYIADKLPPSFGDNFEAYRYTNMLSSPKSHERNIYNNLFNTLITRPVDIAIQSIYDIAKHPNNPVARDVSLSDVPRYYKHVFTSFGNAMEAAKEGMKNQPLTADLQGNAAIEQIRRGKVAKPLQIIPKFMQAQDSFFSTLIASGEKARLLKNGLSEEAANKGAREIAESYLLRDKLGKSTDKGYISRALDSLGKVALEGRKLPVVGKAWSWFVPFVTTPINAAKMMVEHSVLGLPGAKMSSENLAKATVGSMITAYGAMLAAQDKVTWEAPTDQKQKEMYYASGKKPFSILVGDKWVPAWYLGPYALALMMPAAVKQYNDESPTALTDDQITKLGRAVSSISKFIVSQTPLSGVGGFFSMLEGDSDYTMSNLAGGTATQAIPLASMQRYINTIIDPIYRKGSDFEAQIKKSLLGQTEGLQPYLTPTGEESKRLPANAVLPYDIGQRDLKYEPYEKARRDKLQQNKQINLAKKQAQEGKPVSAAGGVYFNMDGSTVDVGKVASMPSTSGFDKVKKQEATYKILDDVLKLPIDQQEEALKKLDITPYQAQYYQVSNSSVEAKTAFVQDQIESMINSGSTRNDVIGQLIKLREDVNGTQIASDNVLKKLVDQNIISQQDYNNLKQVKLENGQIKRKVTGRAKKAKMPKYNYEALKLKTVYKPKKVKIRRIKI